MLAIASERGLMPHLHLSLQAGDDLILKRMKRRHLREDAIRFCEEARRLRPDIVFGADIIAGFPTEPNRCSKTRWSLVRDCDLTFLHVFPYSPRKGTPAARMPQVRGPAIRDRAARPARRRGRGPCGPPRRPAGAGAPHPDRRPADRPDRTVHRSGLRGGPARRRAGDGPDHRPRRHPPPRLNAIRPLGVNARAGPRSV